jgi:general secretion pathway protein I
MKRARGFTLLEVLIALAITAIALSLGMGAVQGGARTLAALETGALAGFALDNALSAQTLEASPPQAGQRSEEATLLGRTFVIHTRTARPAGPLPLSVLDVTVAASEAPTALLARGRREELDASPAP